MGATISKTRDGSRTLFALKLRVEKGKKFSEIAAIMGVHAASVRNMVARALRGDLKRRPGEDPYEHDSWNEGGPHCPRCHLRDVPLPGRPAEPHECLPSSATASMGRR